MSVYSKLASTQETDNAKLWTLNRKDLVAYKAAEAECDEEGMAKSRQRLWERNLKLIYVVRSKHLGNNRNKYPDEDLAPLFFMAVTRSLPNYNMDYDVEPMSWPNHAINNLRYEIQVADRDRMGVHMSMRDHRKVCKGDESYEEVRMDWRDCTPEAENAFAEMYRDEDEYAKKRVQGLLDRTLDGHACQTRARKVQIVARVADGYSYKEIGEAYGITPAHAAKLAGQGIALVRERALIDADLDGEDAAY